ncbi:Bax inhibitor-1/YccA family protein [Emticicia sp. BO119]|uniref:Bax inhibitor-1/YccA family protein n=1 Tax=Emticicia sp. BO119 TaxID=2757768 RepID=UPI0015F0BE29|nr:Bax inhibitor-1/YccA family protein [Emticicia sp. BO119]MBA4853119.1 Bax inhibitor-1/YccA family protein [Emticicia sp. BO119]
MANPAFSEKTFTKINFAQEYGDVMTVQSTLTKVGILLFILLASSAVSWIGLLEGWSIAPMLIPAGCIGGLLCAIVLAFKKEWAPQLAPTYALLEGLAIGAISAIFQDLAFMAAGLTFGVVLIMWFLYKTKILQATQRFIFGVTAATGAIFLVYLVTWILGMFGISIPYIHEGGKIGIIFSLVVVTIAAMNLIIDFHLIEQGAAMRAPKFMEWYSAFGLMVTIIWLYLEILKLLAKISRK